MTDLKPMTRTLTHRGPDADGIWHDQVESVHLGHRRLSILDIDGGKQPMWTAGGKLCIVYNGEIYNHLELRQILENKGHVFVTDHSDTEVLLHGFLEWGYELPNHQHGKSDNRAFLWNIWVLKEYLKERSIHCLQ